MGSKHNYMHSVGDKYILNFPVLRKWINECAICGRKGYDPNMPNKITVVEGSVEVIQIKKFFQPLAVNNLGVCEICAKLIKK